MKRSLLGQAGNAPNLILNYDVATRCCTFDDRGCYESRNSSTRQMLLLALAQVSARLERSFRVRVFTDDYVEQPPLGLHFAYCSDGTAPQTVLIPDFVFWAWPEVGIADYESMVERLLAASEHYPSDPRAFWIGNPKTHASRERLLEIAGIDRRICAQQVHWLSNNQNLATGRKQTAGDNYVSLPDHCRYKYLIDLRGRSYSCRLKLLLFTGRLLFVQDRKWKEYFSDNLIPFEHYVPIREDLRDLSEKLDWAEAHPTEVERIGHQAREFARCHLRREHAVHHLGESLARAASASKPWFLWPFKA